MAGQVYLKCVLTRQLVAVFCFVLNPLTCCCVFSLVFIFNRLVVPHKHTTHTHFITFDIETQHIPTIYLYFKLPIPSIIYILTSFIRIYESL